MKSNSSSVLCVVLLVILKQVGGLVLTASTTQSHPMEGYSTALTCDVQDMSDSQIIIWNKDQKFITWGDSMGHMMSSRFELVMNDMGNNMTTYTLNINDVTRDDDGRYQCQVLQGNEDGYSAVASESLILSVLYFPASNYPECSISGSMTLLTDTELLVSCMSEVGNPQISSVWTTEFSTVPQPIHSIDELPNMVVARLDLLTTSDLDGAVYVCRVSSPAYPNLNRNCTLGPLRVIEWPIVSVTRSVPRVAEGADIHFSCTTEPNMPNLKWVTYPPIDPDRLVLKENGSVLTVKNVRVQDNSTYVVCQVPYRDTFEEAGSVILIDQPWIGPTKPTHATSQLCLPWFGAFIFTAAVNVILCILITSLLLKLKRVSSKPKHAETSGSTLNGTGERKKKDGIVLTWPATSTNWAMTSEKLLRDQRRQSWRSFPQPSDTDSLKEGASTYMPLTPAASLMTQPHHAVSLPMLDKIDYVTPKNRTQHERSPKKATQTGVQSPIKSSKTTPGKKSTGGKPTSSKPSETSKKSAIKTVSAGVHKQPPSQVGSTTYMDLNAKVTEASPEKATYQPLQKKDNSSQSTSKSATGKKSTKAGKDEMAGDSGIYDASSSYMGLNQNVKSLKQQGSRMDDNPTYMPAHTIQSKDSRAQISKHRPGTTSSKSSTDAYDAPCESTPPGSPVYSTGTTDDDMGDAIYRKAPGKVAGGRNTKQGSSRATISSRAPLPDPRTPAKREDSTSTDESYKDPYSGKLRPNQEYFTLEPDNQYTNYGADISSECDSYQGGEAFDWDETTATARKVERKTSTATNASYLELEDVEGEVKGYMIMKKADPNQLKTPSKFIKKTQSVPETDSSCGEYYEQMEEGKQYEYAIPPSNQLAAVDEGADLNHETVSVTKQDGSMKHSRSSEEPKKKKKAGWGIFRK